jgi:hypothetical protein
LRPARLLASIQRSIWALPAKSGAFFTLQHGRHLSTVNATAIRRSPLEFPVRVLSRTRPKMEIILVLVVALIALVGVGTLVSAFDEPD